MYDVCCMCIQQQENNCLHFTQIKFVQFGWENIKFAVFICLRLSMSYFIFITNKKKSTTKKKIGAIGPHQSDAYRKQRDELNGIFLTVKRSELNKELKLVGVSFRKCFSHCLQLFLEQHGSCNR